MHHRVEFYPARWRVFGNSKCPVADAVGIIKETDRSEIGPFFENGRVGPVEGDAQKQAVPAIQDI